MAETNGKKKDKNSQQEELLNKHWEELVQWWKERLDRYV